VSRCPCASQGLEPAQFPGSVVLTVDAADGMQGRATATVTARTIACSIRNRGAACRRDVTQQSRRNHGAQEEAATNSRRSLDLLAATIRHQTNQPVSALLSLGGSTWSACEACRRSAARPVSFVPPISANTNVPKPSVAKGAWQRAFPFPHAQKPPSPG
jgi:hypothetical protein